ncbi:MAG: insulinase family protein [Tenericutes bacterium]|nr:insulinase family protein [Mycoplasmatota bacterium]
MENPIKKTINGIDVYYIVSDKYKTITCSLIFTHEQGLEKINEYYFLSNILIDNMKNYPSNEKKYRYLSSLYGLEAFGSAKNIGNHISNQFVVTYPNERYIKGEDSLSENAFKFLVEMVMNPKMRKGNFTKKVLDESLEEANQLFSILKSIKDMHAYYNYTKIFYEDKAELKFDFPSIDYLDKVSLETLLEAYLDFFTTSKIFIFVTGNIDEAKMDRIIERNLPKKFVSHNFELKKKTYLYNPNYETKILKEHYDVSQSRIFMGYLSNVEYFSDRHAAMSIFNDIFGGFDQSLLFTKIREEDNLAYYVDSNYMPDEQTVTVAVSCEVIHEDEVLEKVKVILEEIKAGNFSDEIFNQAKDSCINAVHSINDSQTTYLLQHIKNYQLFDTKYDLEKRLETYQSVTKQDVIEVANSLVLDTVYFYTKGDTHASK